MWSGPRNISTALMRSFENRPDTFVSDEPLYAHYLNNKDIISQIDHTILFFILLIFGKSNLKINFSYKTYLLLTFIILYTTQYKDIYGFK